MEIKSSDFAGRLKHWMTIRNINDADLARQVFGTMIDERGYVVAKNRQLIGRYKVGRVVPKPVTQKAIFEALEMTRDVFFGMNGHAGTTDHGAGKGDLSGDIYRSLSKVLLEEGPQAGTKTIEISAVVDEASAKQIVAILLLGQEQWLGLLRKQQMAQNRIIWILVGGNSQTAVLNAFVTKFA